MPLGILRGRHSEVRPTDRPGIYYVHSSPFITIVWLLAFVARAGIRYFIPGASEGATAAIAVSAFIVHQKLQAAMQQPRTS